MQKRRPEELIYQQNTTKDHSLIYQPSELRHTFARTLEARAEAARPRLLRVAHLNGIKPDDAEDVVQETLLEAWRQHEKLRKPERFTAWLDGICRNICKRYLRTQATTPHMSELPTNDDKIDTLTSDLLNPLAIDPAEELEHQEMQALLTRALGYLSSRRREVIELCYLAQIPQREVAQQLDMSLGALELQLHRTRRQLYQILHGELREDALASGLFLNVDESIGWQETPQWCWLCGKQRLRATFERQPGSPCFFRVRCPDCSPRYDIDILHTGEYHLLHQ